MRLGGLTEVAHLLKVSRQRALQLRHREDFPEPVGELGQGAVWDLDDIRAWARSGTRAPGRPRADVQARVVGQRFVLDETPMINTVGAEVFRGTDRRNGEPIALKFVDLGDVSARHIEQFERDLRRVEALAHPNVLPILAHGRAADGRRWLAMPLANGSLADFAPQIRGNVGAIADIFRQLVLGLGVAHSAGVLHRNIKPENILRREDGTWSLSDFGLTSRPFVAVDTPFVQTWSDRSLRFMAPEVVKDPDAASVQSDIFSLGRVVEDLTVGDGRASSSEVRLFDLVIAVAVHPVTGDRFKGVAEFEREFNRALTRTVEINAWGDPDLAAETLHARVTGAVTPDVELFRILDWASRLRPTAEKEMRALTRVLPWLDDAALLRLAAHDIALLETVFERFARFVEEATFSFEYCDEFADFARRAIEVTQSGRIVASSVRFLAIRGEAQQRWYVRDVLIDVLARLKVEEHYTSALGALAQLDEDIVRWNLNEFALRAMPPRIREELAWLGAAGPLPRPGPLTP